MTNLGQITTITTGLPPMVDGVGDYSWHLAQQIRADFGVQTRFIVGNPRWQSDKAQEFSVESVDQRSAKALLKLLDGSDTVLLHYVGYGYAKRGSPTWLVRALEQWRRSDSNRYLLIMFHEVYAYVPNLLSSQFWTSPLQKHLAGRLVRLGDRHLTSKEFYGQRVINLSRGKHTSIVTLPVFSNVGEPSLDHLPDLAERPRRLVVFGGGGSRSRVYQRSLPALERTCRELAIEEIIDIGPPLDFVLPLVNGMEITQLGIQDKEVVSKYLCQSLVGFFDYSLDFLAKSTIFAAYSAHRLLPVGVFYLGGNEDGLECNQHYWLGNSHPSTMCLGNAQLVADRAYSWYQQHRLGEQAKVFLAHLPPTINQKS